MPHAWPHTPGVPAAGHVTSRGWWHPGRIDGCAKCPAPLPPRRRCADCGRWELPPLHPADPDRCPACDGPLVEV